MKIDNEIINTIYNNASLGHDYQLHTLTKAQVIAMINRLRQAEKQVQAIKVLTDGVEAAKLTWPQSVSIVFDIQKIVQEG